MQTMNYKEAARYLKVTEGTLRNWVSKGRIKPRKVGKHVLFFKEGVTTPNGNLRTLRNFRTMTISFQNGCIDTPFRD